MTGQQGDPIGDSFYNDQEAEGNQGVQEKKSVDTSFSFRVQFIFCFLAQCAARRLERGLAVDVAIGTGIGVAGVGSKLKVMECLDRGYVIGTDSVYTFDFRTFLDDEVDNEEGCSRVEIEDIDTRDSLLFLLLKIRIIICICFQRIIINTHHHYYYY